MKKILTAPASQVSVEFRKPIWKQLMENQEAVDKIDFNSVVFSASDQKITGKKMIIKKKTKRTHEIEFNL